MRFIAGHRVNRVYGELMEKIKDSMNGQEKEEIIETVIRSNIQWLNDAERYKVFRRHFMKWIGEYFQSELVLILLFHDDVTAMRQLAFLQKLDRHGIGWRKLASNNKEVEERVKELKTEFDSYATKRLIEEIKEFVAENKKLNEKRVESWSAEDLSRYLLQRVLNEMEEIRSNKMPLNSFLPK